MEHILPILPGLVLCWLVLELTLWVRLWVRKLEARVRQLERAHMSEMSWRRSQGQRVEV